MKYDVFGISWLFEWGLLLTEGVVVRSLLNFRNGGSFFEAELLAADGKKGVIYSIHWRRSLGEPHGLSTMNIRRYDQNLEKFLMDWYDRWSVEKNEKVAVEFLGASAHIAAVRQARASDELFVTGAHQLLMAYYGMIHEVLISRATKKPEDDGTTGRNTVFWEVRNY